MDITTALAQAKRPERVVQLCLRGDLIADFQAAEAKLADLDRHDLATASLAGGGERRQVAEQIEALREQMADASAPVRMRAVSRREWTRLLAEHPPREGDLADRGIGINRDSFFPALIRACTVDPALTDEQWIQLLDETLTSAQFDSLADAAWEVNRAEVSVPFSRSALRTLTSTEDE